VLVGSFLAKIATFPLTTIWTQRLQKIAVGGIAAIRYSPDATINSNGLGNSCHASHFANIPNSCHTSHFANIPVTATNCFLQLLPTLLPVIVYVCAAMTKKKSNFIICHVTHPKKAKKQGGMPEIFFVVTFLHFFNMKTRKL